MTSSKFQQPPGWLRPDDGRSPHSSEDVLDAPYPPSGAIKPRNAAVEAGAWADWNLKETITDSHGHKIDVTVSWNERHIQFVWDIRNLMEDGDVWIGFGFTEDETTERWQLVAEARPDEQSWGTGSDGLRFNPCTKQWWFQILVEPKSLHTR